MEEQRQTNIESVPFPVYKSSPLGLIQDQSGKKYKFGQVVLTFPLQDGGLFINSPEIKNEMIADVVSLFASIVKYNEKKTKYTEYDSPLYDVLPSIFINFANESCAGSGFCLLKQCLCHTLDPKAFPLMETDAFLLFMKKMEKWG